MIEAGSILQNRYRVEKQIGQGGMGAVYVATDERFGSTVAIKETLFGDDRFRRAFEREARLLNSLRHPALPRVSDHFVDGNGQFLVMEYIDGLDLAERLEQEGEVFAVPDVLDWADQLLDALEYLHAQEMPVIHRDIKPQNLKLTARGQIILLDFGLAKGNTTSAESATAAKSVFGYSRNYASLEQIQGTGTDPRSDIYSLAATLYHLLTGVPPADALTRAMVVLSDKDDPLVEADRIRREIPAGVARVLQRSMALNAEQRPATAKEMRAQLDRVKDEKPSNDAAAIIEKVDGADFFSQKTQLQAGAAKLSSLKQSEMKTAVMPQNDTQKTNLSTGDFGEEATRVRAATASATDDKPNRRSLVIGAAVAGLLLVAVAAAGVFVYRPVSDAHDRTTPARDQKRSLTAVQTDAAPPANAAANADAVSQNNAETNAAQANSAAHEPAKETTAKTETRPAASKNAAAAPKAPTRRPPDDEPPMIVVDEETDEEIVVEESNVARPPRPPVDPRTGQRFPVFVWRQMSPKDRAELRKALELQRQMEKEKRLREKQKREIKPPEEQ